MKKLFTLVIASIFLLIAGPAQASVIDLLNGSYEVNYNFDLQVGTIHGSDITDIYILETNGTQIGIDYTFSAAAMGPSVLSHEISFDPTRSLILGLDRAPANSGLDDHLVVFMDNDFAADAFTKPKFSDIFPAVGGRDRVRHNALAQALKDAQLGDADALQLISDFFTKDAGQFAAFDPEGSFRVFEFTGPTPIDVIPEPATMLLFGTGLAGAFLRKRSVA